MICQEHILYMYPGKGETLYASTKNDLSSDIPDFRVVSEDIYCSVKRSSTDIWSLNINLN